MVLTSNQWAQVGVATQFILNNNTFVITLSYANLNRISLSKVCTPDYVYELHLRLARSWC